MRLQRRHACLALPLAALGCALAPRPATVPMRTQVLPAQAEARAPVLVAMLPGAYDRPDDFVAQGLVAAVREQRVAADLWLVDAHRGYLEQGTMLERLRADVVEPARAFGYRRVWLVGISLGGFAALACALREPAAIDGVLAIAPYVGRHSLLQEIARAGGPRAWSTAARSADDGEAAWWAAMVNASPERRSSLFLYTAGDDRFIAGHRLLATLLAAQQVLEMPGDHDWPTWRALWARWLERAPWPRLQG